ncbi:MAG: iron ABC transporter substrate-binding protein, partial [Actinobacteria bacterium]|nr:iron ABC transporter substrate-binding protein [Actinomycetota bacterium]
MTRAKLFPLIAAVPAIAFALAACAGSSDDQSADSSGSTESATGKPVVVYSGRSEELIEP